MAAYPERSDASHRASATDSVRYSNRCRGPLLDLERWILSSVRIDEVRAPFNGQVSTARVRVVRPVGTVTGSALAAGPPARQDGRFRVRPTIACVRASITSVLASG